MVLLSYKVYDLVEGNLLAMILALSSSWPLECIYRVDDIVSCFKGYLEGTVMEKSRL